MPLAQHKSFVHWANGEIHSSQIMLSMLCIEMSGMMDAQLRLMFLYCIGEISEYWLVHLLTPSLPSELYSCVP